jgi:hypothetical protein
MAAAFALTPAVAVIGVINYNTSEGQKLYASATAKLAEEQYDCKPDGLGCINSYSPSATEQGNSDGTTKLEEYSKFRKTRWTQTWTQTT